MIKRISVACIIALVSFGAMHDAEARNPRGQVKPGGTGSPCPVSFGNGTLSPMAVHSIGISPLTVWFDAVNDTNTVGVSAIGTAFQDHVYSWSFGDGGASGTGTWSIGASPGVNSKNADLGGVAAHMYLTPGFDQAYTATLTAYDGTNLASCTLSVTAFDPSGLNGWPGAATQCVGNVLPVAGSGGCPSGASVLASSTIPSLNLNNKRILFHCGDLFQGNPTSSGTKGSVGAYGGCENTTTGRPTLQAAGAADQLINLTNPSQDIRFSDIVLDAQNFNGGGGNDREAIVDNQNGGSINAGNKPAQYTFYNIHTINHGSSLRWNAGAQMAVVSSNLDVPNQPASGNCPPPYTNCSINLFVNFAGTGAWSTSGPIPNEDYLFVAGNLVTNVTNKSLETMRDSYASKHVIVHNSMTNAGPSYANLKLHDICFATNGGTGAFCGVYTQYDFIADNNFGGSSGANMVEVAPQNAITDERMRFIVFERNMLGGTASGANGRMLELSGTNITVRDNVCPNLGTTSSSGNLCVAAFRTGIEPVPTALEIYNNTCGGGGNSCIGLGGFGFGAAATNSVVQNNLAFNSSGLVAVANSGTGNTVSPNSSPTTGNPGFTNGSGTLSVLSDFRPTANYTGALNGVPVFFDALGNPWSPTWDLGAVHH